LTGHKSLAPPLKTIRDLSIQGYFEKSDQFSQLELLVESCVKAIRQLNTIRDYRDSLETANRQLLDANHQIQSYYDDLVVMVRSVVDARDIYTRGHSDRVSLLAMKISDRMGRSSEETARIKTTALFHDIGKIRIPDSILLKEGSLTPEERNFIKQHPEYAVDILSKVDMLADTIPGVLQHHERFDGEGYPNHLRGREICEEARIISVADTFDAMTSYRRYRVNMTLEQARDEIMRGKGTQFDPEIADLYLSLLEDFDVIKSDPDWVVSYTDTDHK
ncbi:MAG: HD-GYP domain-containing protein, partial [Synergistaceae bacterium]|nr:HD-GYP domain-containing protein [Synergistaceae bacterium]